MAPSTKPLRTPDGVPEPEASVWEEARTCLGVGAYHAAVMLCRKILFHIAVAKGMPPKNDRDRAPSFFEAVDHLQNKGVFTAEMRTWVDPIKDVGNEANHEIEPITKEQAQAVATFTETLLMLAYELEHRRKLTVPPPPTASDQAE